MACTTPAHRRHPNTVTACAVAAMLTTLAIAAARADVPTKIDPQATDVLKRMAKAYTDAPAMAYRAKIRRGQTLDGDRTVVESAFDLAMRRPDRVSITPAGDNPEMKGSIIRSQNRLYQFDPASNRYALSDAEGPLADVLSGDAFDTLCGEVVSLAALPMRTDPYKAVMTGVVSAEYGGLVERDGVSMHRIALEEDQIGWRLWIEAGDRPVLRRIEADLSKLSQTAKQQGHELEAFVEVDLASWRFGDAVGDAAFAIQPPSGAAKVATLFGHPLEGQRAPLFELPGLDGKVATLAAHRGKDVVVLDFWATWCGPCVGSMPGLAKLAKSYRDAGKNVAVYAINIGEDPATVKAFIDKQKLDVNVLFDGNSAMARAYQANAIPESVIIDRQGIIQKVYVGAGPDLHENMRAQIDKLLDK
ncbi:MAG: redoxin domain-containing protein [Phycisphaera sp.]|nr:redoxin domain-containing protein [Phycisphaera sp.]